MRVGALVVTSCGCGWNVQHVCDLFAVCVMSGDLFVSGGYEVDAAVETVERYNISTDIWTPTAPMLYGRAQHRACAVGQSMYVIGGFDSDINILDSVLRYDSSTEVWTEMNSMPGARYGVAVCAVGSDLFVFGGNNNQQVATDTVYRYSTETNEWIILDPCQSQDAITVCV